jgi:hypothetical protein
MRWFDPAGFVALVEEHRVQSAALVPSMIQMLLTQPLEEHDLSCLERIGSGGAPLAVEVALELERRVPTVEVREGLRLHGDHGAHRDAAAAEPTAGLGRPARRRHRDPHHRPRRRAAPAARTARSACAGRW